MDIERLIDADKLPLDIMPEDIDNAPTINAVPVVRCRECVYAQEKYGHVECLNGISYRNTYNDPDMFCSYGKILSEIVGDATNED